MDLVAIGSPSALHAEQGIAAAERGLHVLVEKPLDITTARADALIAAADRAGVKLGVFFQDRLKPDVVKLKAMVDAGVVGRPILASGRVKWYRPPEYYGGSRWRGTFTLDGGGALINQAIHTARPDAPPVGADRQRRRAGRHAAPRDRGRGHGRGDAAVRERRAGRVRSLDGGLPRLRATRRADGQPTAPSRSSTTASSASISRCPTRAFRQSRWARPRARRSTPRRRPSRTPRRTGASSKTSCTRSARRAGRPATDRKAAAASS